MDCHMPNMDGIEAAQIIREREREGVAARTPIIALTANARGEDYERCIAVGMDDYLTKPLTLHELRATLERWIRHPSAAPVEGPAPTSGDSAVAEPVAVVAEEPARATVVVDATMADVVVIEPPAADLASAEPASPPAEIEAAPPVPVEETSPPETPDSSAPVTMPPAAAAPEPAPPEAAPAAVAPAQGATMQQEAAPAPRAVESAAVGDALDKTTIDYLRTLRRGDGPSVLERAIDMYLENAPAALEELRRSVASGDASAVWKIAHGLKSSSASLGAKQLAQHIAEMEGRARQSDLAEADTRLVRIETEYHKVSTALRETLREEKEKCRQTA